MVGFQWLGSNDAVAGFVAWVPAMQQLDFVAWVLAMQMVVFHSLVMLSVMKRDGKSLVVIDFVFHKVIFDEDVEMWTLN